MEYQAKSTFRVYTLRETGAYIPNGRVIGLSTEVHRGFHDYDETLKWIQAKWGPADRLYYP